MRYLFAIIIATSLFSTAFANTPVYFDEFTKLTEKDETIKKMISRDTLPESKLMLNFLSLYKHLNGTSDTKKEPSIPFTVEDIRSVAEQNQLLSKRFSVVNPRIFVTPKQMPQLYKIVKSISEKMGMDHPLIFLIVKDQTNFAHYPKDQTDPVSSRLNTDESASTALKLGDTRFTALTLDVNMLKDFDQAQLEGLLAHTFAADKAHHNAKVQAVRLGWIVTGMLATIYTLSKTTDNPSEKNAWCFFAAISTLLGNLIFTPVVAGKFSRVMVHEEDLEAVKALGTSVGLRRALEAIDLKGKHYETELQFIESQIKTVNFDYQSRKSFENHLQTQEKTLKALINNLRSSWDQLVPSPQERIQHLRNSVKEAQKPL